MYFFYFKLMPRLGSWRRKTATVYCKKGSILIGCKEIGYTGYTTATNKSGSSFNMRYDWELIHTYQDTLVIWGHSMPK